MVERLTEKVTLKILNQITEALLYLHSKSMHHGALSLQNIHITDLGDIKLSQPYISYLQCNFKPHQSLNQKALNSSYAFTGIVVPSKIPKTWMAPDSIISINSDVFDLGRIIKQVRNLTLI